ncbi:hypothetical protein KBZ21_35340, partial [Streptomyces sp. A73]|nr:hypothetical protein [Streptomyces sp. A73]
MDGMTYEAAGCEAGAGDRQGAAPRDRALLAVPRRAPKETGFGQSEVSTTMRTTTARRTALGALGSLALLLPLAACGSDDP